MSSFEWTASSGGSSLAKLEAELRRAQVNLEAKRDAKKLEADGEIVIANALAAIRSMATVLRDERVTLDRRREVLRGLPPKREGVEPILVEIDPAAARGWRRGLVDGLAARERQLVTEDLEAERALVGAETSS